MAVEQISLEIATPKGMFSGTFPKTAKIKDVIEAVVQALGLMSGDVFELFHAGSALQPIERPLVSFGLSGDTQLDLVATGSGV